VTFTSAARYALDVLAWIATVITIVAGGLALYDHNLSRRVERAPKAKLPLLLRRPISITTLTKSMERFSRILADDDFLPEVIIGVNYQGTLCGAILARVVRARLFTAYVSYETEGPVHWCSGITLLPEVAEALAEKRVLVIDNSEGTGRTLRMTLEEVRKHSTNVRSVVVFKRKDNENHLSQWADYVLFYSRSHLNFLR
jgi:hypoxanthine phosphoribosyltransferase